MRLAIASDHGGFELKEHLLAWLAGRDDIAVADLGTRDEAAVDYPDLAHPLAEAVARGDFDRGILVCGTGIGMSIAANRHRGIRAALCTDPYMARMSREHNDANVLCLGGRVLGRSLAEDIVRAFLDGEFGGERHARRLAKLDPR
ncbi:MAG TPA: ribose 5-phosphate isomerase B [Polyangia bacterium]|nr:ribose 5-phosphate isomerase B [Polyangia bacterium]